MTVPTTRPAAGERPRRGPASAAPTDVAAGSLVVSEVFGPTFQGEGPSTGRRASFVRLGGCNLHCSWCVAPDTPVLRADGTHAPISEVRVGELVWSYRDHRYELARVEHTYTREHAERVEVRYGDRSLVCTPDHVFATAHHLDGVWRSTADELHGRHLLLTHHDAPDSSDISETLDVSGISMPGRAVRGQQWWTGWLRGLVLGAGGIQMREGDPTIWLRLADRKLAEAFSAKLNRRGARTQVREYPSSAANGAPTYHVASPLSAAPDAIGLPDTPRVVAGFVAGFFDATAHLEPDHITMTQADDKTLIRVSKMCATLEIPHTTTACATHPGHISIDGLHSVERFLAVTQPLRTHHDQSPHHDQPPHHDQRSRPEQSARYPGGPLTPVGVDQVKTVAAGPVINLTTTTGYFFAGGALVEQCDSAYTWDARRHDLRVELTRRPVSSVVAEIDQHGTDLVVLTGGEPLLHQHQPGWPELLDGLTHPTGVSARPRHIEVETNGTRHPSPDTVRRVTRFNVSPKLTHAGDPAHQRIRPDVLAAFRDSGKACFKFVARMPADLDEIDALITPLDIPPELVWVMPEGLTSRAILAHSHLLADPVLARGYNLSTRLHVLLWANQRKR